MTSEEIDIKIEETIAQGKLTQRQVNYARSYVEIGSGSGAYKEHYTWEGMKPRAIATEAYRLRCNPYISRIIGLLREKLQIQHEMTANELADRYIVIADAAMEEGKHSAAVAAMTGIGKLYGLISDKPEPATINFNIPKVIDDV